MIVYCSWQVFPLQFFLSYTHQLISVIFACHISHPVIAHLSDCSVLVAGLPACTEKPLQMVQSRAEHLLLHRPERSHVTHSLTSTGCPRLPESDSSHWCCPRSDFWVLQASALSFRTLFCYLLPVRAAASLLTCRNLWRLISSGNTSSANTPNQAWKGFLLRWSLNL